MRKQNMRIINMLLAVVLVLFSSSVFGQQRGYVTHDKFDLVVCFDPFSASELNKQRFNNTVFNAKLKKFQDDFDCLVLKSDIITFVSDDNEYLGYYELEPFDPETGELLGTVYSPFWHYVKFSDTAKKVLSE